jgi:hypothetical protein
MKNKTRDITKGEGKSGTTTAELAEMVEIFSFDVGQLLSYFENFHCAPLLRDPLSKSPTVESS